MIYNMQKHLDRIEAKLDKLLEQKATVEKRASYHADPDRQHHPTFDPSAEVVIPAGQSPYEDM